MFRGPNTHLLEFSVVGHEVPGALGVVRPGSVVTGHQLPVPGQVTLAVGSP